MGICQPYWTHQEIMGEASASPTNPNKVRSGKCRKNNSDRLRDVSTSDEKCMGAWPWMNLIYVYKKIT